MNITKKETIIAATGLIAVTVAKSLKILSLSVAVSLVLLCIGCKPEPLQEDDRVVFIGDSITACGLWADGWITLVNKAIQEKQPDLGVLVIGSGISGNRSTDVLARMSAILTTLPSVSVLYVGTNDCWGRLNGTGNSLEVYRETILQIVDKLDDTSRVILCTPATLGETNGGWKLLDDYANVIREIAVDKRLQLVDLRDVFYKQLKDNVKPFGVLTVDGVHPNRDGNRLIAEEILKGLCVGL